MRSSKSILAGIAAGALTAGLIPFALVATATSAQAATTLSVDQSLSRAGVTLDDTTATINNSEAAAPAVRVYVQPSADITGLSAGAGKVNVRVDSAPTGAGVTLGTVYQSDAIAGTVLADDSVAAVDLVGGSNALTLAAFNVAGTYGVTVWVSPTGASTVGAGDVTYLGNVTLAGTPTTIAFAEPAQTGPAAVADTNAVALVDAAGRVTRLGGGESVPLSAAANTGATGSLYISQSTPTTATLNLTTASASAAALSDGYSYGYALVTTSGATGSFTTTAAGAGIGVATNPTSVFTVEAQTTTKNINVSATNLASDWAGPVTADDTTEVRSDTTALTFTVTADDTATAGELLPLTFAFSGATAVAVDGEAITTGATLYKAIGADKTASFAVAVTGPSSSTVVTATTGAAINADLRVDWDDASYSLTTSPADGGAVVLATGSDASIVAETTDQFGNPYIGACINGSNGTTTTATQTTGTDGKVTVTIPAPASGTSATLTVTAKTQGCASALTGSPSTISAIYGEAVVTLSGVSTTSVDETVAVPSQVSANNNFKAVTANVKVGGVNVPNGTIVSFSGSEGVRFGSAATGTWAASTATKDAPVAGGAGNVTVYVTASKAGTATVTATAAGVAESGELTVETVTGTSRSVDVSAPAVADAGAITPVAITVADGFGNGMSGISVDMAIPISSIGRFANGLRQITVTTDANGQAVADVTTGTNESGILTVTGTLTTAAQSADAANVPAGTEFAAGQRADSAAIDVKAGPGDRSIVIAGERGTVRGKPGVKFEGATEGFNDGDVVKPWIKFPGQTSYSEGSARPEIDEVGDFAWERKTGKKIYVYFTSDDDAVKSNRVIIQAK